MPKLSANNYRVFIESATTGSFNVVAGQISHTIDRGEVSYSTVDKASTVEVTERAMRNYAMSMEYRPDLPDANTITVACDGRFPFTFHANGNITWVTPEGGGGPTYPNM